MRRTLTLAALVAALATGVGFGTSAATGPQSPTPVTSLDYTDEALEPTGRAYQTPAPATVNPSSVPGTTASTVVAP